MTAGTHCGFPLPISRSFWPTTGGYGNGLEAPAWAAVLDYLDCGPELVQQSRARVVFVVGETTQPPRLRHRRRGLHIEAACWRLSHRPTTISCGCHPWRGRPIVQPHRLVSLVDASRGAAIVCAEAASVGRRDAASAASG